MPDTSLGYRHTLRCQNFKFYGLNLSGVVVITKKARRSIKFIPVLKYENTAHEYKRGLILDYAKLAEDSNRNRSFGDIKKLITIII